VHDCPQKKSQYTQDAKQEKPSDCAHDPSQFHDERIDEELLFSGSFDEAADICGASSKIRGFFAPLRMTTVWGDIRFA
jgi:hypothetical protein